MAKMKRQRLIANHGAAMDIAMIRNVALMRSELLRTLQMDGPGRDLDAECGYPDTISIEMYRRLYQRNGIARRVVKCLPDECWAMEPLIYEVEEADKITKFEEAWDDLNDRVNVLHYMHRIDVLSGVGQFGVLLMGLDDGKQLHEPVEGIDDTGEATGGVEHKLLYLRAFDESCVTIKTRELDASNPRFGRPVMYNINYQDMSLTGSSAGEVISRDVHWTRVIHVADDPDMSEVFGTPRLQPIFDRMVDLRKILGGSAEMYWRGAFPGYSFEVNPDLVDQNVEIDADSLREEFDNYTNGLQRYLATKGLIAKQLSPQVVDPSGHTQNELQAIAIAVGIPFRILFGSEQAQLASEQDSRAWNKRLEKRQTKYVTPMIIRATIDRFIDLGILPEPEKKDRGVKRYTVEWPDLNIVTDEDKARVGAARTAALAQYVGGGVDQLVPPEPYMTQILGMGAEQVSEILDEAEEYNEEMAEKQAEQMDHQMQAAAAAGIPGGGPPGAPGAQPPAVPPKKKPALVTPTDNEEWDESEHPRDEDGQFTEKGTGKATRDISTIRDMRGNKIKALPKHLEGVAIAPNWVDVRVSMKATSAIWVSARDTKGRRVYLRSPSAVAAAAIKKYNRVREMNAEIGSITRMMARDTGDDAACLRLISATGIRPGSAKDTRAEKLAYGATTLLGKHVVVNDDGVSLQFTGKKGVDLTIPITDKALANELKQRAERVGPSGRLFNTSYARLNKYTERLTGGKYTPKDFRTLVASRTAVEMVSTMAVPQNEKEYKKAVKTVATAVSAKLGNTPTVALQSYIDPHVFMKWRGYKNAKRSEVA